MLRFKLLFFFFLSLPGYAFLGLDSGKEKTSIVKELKRELIPMSKTVFKEITLKTGSEKIVDLTGKDFILVSVREKGSDGRFYAVDSDGTVWWSGVITSGTLEFRSPSGVFNILEKKRYYMSKEYPEESGINNMDFMMKFTHQGHALHKGSIGWLSHGCIHIDPKDVPAIYRWSKYGMPVVVTRHTYMPFARSDLKKIYTRR